MIDAIDLSTVTIHNSPADIASWPATIAITRVELQNDSAPMDQRGFSFAFTPALPPIWKWFPNPGGSLDNFHYTVWLIVEVNGVKHASGIIQMWENRTATGAPIEQHFDDWCYDRARWGDMVDFVPRVGSVIGLFVSAGNARGQGVVSSVRERSHVVELALPTNDAGVWLFPSDVPTPAPGPVPGPVPAPGPGPTPGPLPDPPETLDQLFMLMYQQLEAIVHVGETALKLSTQLEAIQKTGLKVHL